MLTKSQRDQIIALVKKEVIPAIGCREPMAVALCVAKAAEVLGCKPEKITARLSANILKNAMGVGIPGTGMIGLPIAIALGALIGKSEYQLEVIKDATPETVKAGKAYIDEKRICIGLKKDITEKLYVEIKCEAGGKSATAIIAGGHTNFVYLDDNGKVLLDSRKPAGKEAESDDVKLDMHTVYDFATESPLEEISFILETKKYNEHAAKEAMKGNYGHDLGKTLERPLS